MAVQKKFCLRFFYRMFMLLALYDVLGHVLFAIYPNIGHPWHDVVACAFLLYEIAFAKIYDLANTGKSTSTLWVILGGKVVKILFAIGLILLYWGIATGPMKPFTVDLLIAYFLTMICESGFLITENKKATAGNMETDIK